MLFENLLFIQVNMKMKNLPEISVNISQPIYLKGNYCFVFCSRKKCFTNVLFKNNNNVIKTRCPVCKIMQCNFFPSNTLVIAGSFDCGEVQVGNLRSGSTLRVSRFEWNVSNQELSVTALWGHKMPGKDTRSAGQECKRQNGRS